MKWHFVRLEEVDSTNDCIKSLPHRYAVVTAEYQTRGRGQGTNTWESERGRNLTFSVRMPSPSIAAGRQFVISMAGALALKSTLDAYAEGFTLKWPNDIYFHDSKISGTLIETSIVNRTIEHFVYGIGINVNQREFRSDAPNPVSLCQITGREMDREEVLQHFLTHLDRIFSSWGKGSEDRIISLYNDSLYRRNGVYGYEDSGGRFRAEIVRVEPDGYLVLCDTDSRIRKYELKEVKFLI